MGFEQKNNPKTILKSIIQNSSLETQQKDLWFSLINKITSAEASDFLATLKDNAENLNFLTQNLQKKFEALQTKDNSLWENIIEEEKEFLQKQV